MSGHSLISEIVKWVYKFVRFVFLILEVLFLDPLVLLVRFFPFLDEKIGKNTNTDE
jgi:hypothetical protein